MWIAFIDGYNFNKLIKTVHNFEVISISITFGFCLINRQKKRKIMFGIKISMFLIRLLRSKYEYALKLLRVIKRSFILSVMKFPKMG